MPVPANEGDRRRHRRIACGGEARISLLPSDGALYFGRLRDLSQGGICLDMPCPLEVGVRAEMLVCISGLTFRTVGLVRTRDRLRAGMEFVHLTAGGRQMLQEFLVNLEELHETMTKLRSHRVQTEAELSRHLKSAGIRPPVLKSRIRLLGSPADDTSERNAEAVEGERMIEPVEAVVRVDVFG
jgi:hypothetical protein